ncbi:MAG TPA: DUF1707 domain-containing protein [Nocardioides sp.]|jgi:hypothetical protein|nr:DUF1707 domain-containing protein [Nocardioides sp.]
MEGPLDPRDPALLRVSDADRHKVAEILRQAAGEGRLDLDELDERLEWAYAAKTYADLIPITADLPVRGSEQLPSPGPHQATGPLVPASRHDSTLAFMGGASRKGLWEVGASHTAFAMWAGITLDLREARLTSRETVIYANAIWAGIDIIVNARTHVIVDGIGIMGGFEQARDKVAPEIGPDSPVLRVKGVALMAGVSVQRKPMPGPRRLKRR